METDVSPLLQYALEMIGVVLLALSAWVARWITIKLKLSADSEVRTYLDQALRAGVNAGMKKARQRLAGKPVTVELENEIVRHAVEYAVLTVPDALRKFGITEARLKDMVTARLPDLPEATTLSDAPPPPQK